jgi:hypothetical protein
MLAAPTRWSTRAMDDVDYGRSDVYNRVRFANKFWDSAAGP